LVARIFLRALVLLALLCTISYGAPEVKLVSDGSDLYASIGVGQWVDLLLTVDPKGEPLAADGLTVVPDGEGVEFKAAIWPPPDGDGAYVKPFVVRVPALVNDKFAHAVKVTLRGKGLDVTGERELRAMDIVGHLKGTAALKAPAQAGKANVVVLKLTLIDGYHVYGTEGAKEGTPLVGALVAPFGAKAEALWAGGGPLNPPGMKHYGEFQFEIPFTPLKAGKLEGRVYLNWQACTDRLCDANEMLYIPFSFDVAEGTGGAFEIPPPAEISAQVEQDLEGNSIWKIILAAIGAGLFALAMPCTYPLIPITISFFTKQAEVRHGNVLPLSLAYGGGIVAIFVGIGVAIGQPIVEFATLWWVNAIFALLFLVFGLSLIGLFEIRLPGAFNDIAAKVSGTGGYMSVFAMGATLVITSFTCTAPFVGSLLVYAGQGGSLGTVALAMGVFGLTMAIPFVFLSLSPKALQAMPRSGMWMKTLKVTLGIVELGLVLKFVSNVDMAWETFVIGRETFLALWAMSFLAAALYLFGFFDLFSKDRAPIGRGRIVAGVLITAMTVYLLSGVTGRRLGARMEAFFPVIERDYGKAFLAVSDDFEKGLALAQEKGVPVFLHFTGFQ